MSTAVPARYADRVTRDVDGEPMAWVALKPCGCVVRVLVDSPHWQKSIERELARCRGQGWEIRYQRLELAPWSFEHHLDARAASAAHAPLIGDATAPAPTTTLEEEAAFGLNVGGPTTESLEPFDGKSNRGPHGLPPCGPLEETATCPPTAFYRPSVDGRNR